MSNGERLTNFTQLNNEKYWQGTDNNDLHGQVLHAMGGANIVILPCANSLTPDPHVHPSSESYTVRYSLNNVLFKF